jgi:hypothetical protein
MSCSPSVETSPAATNDDPGPPPADTTSNPGWAISACPPASANPCSRQAASAMVATRRWNSAAWLLVTPDGGDAYVLKGVVDDWPDDRAPEILQSCSRSMHDGVVLLLVERLIQVPNEGIDDAFVEVTMLVGPGGQESTEAD